MVDTVAMQGKDIQGQATCHTPVRCGLSIQMLLRDENKRDVPSHTGYDIQEQVFARTPPLPVAVSHDWNRKYLLEDM